MPVVEALRVILGVWRLANGRLERPNNRGLWRQAASLNARTTNACGQSAWWKLPRWILWLLMAWRLANVWLERPNNRGLWRQTASLNALTTNACGQCGSLSACWKLLRGILGVWRLANGRLERPNNRGLWRKTAGLNALTTNANGRLERSNNKCKQPAWTL